MSYMPPRRSDGTLQRRREPLAWPAERPFRILAIDGGGLCGILPASVLAELEGRYLGGSSIAGYFDLIAGTSTGGIIALGLAHGLTAREIRDFYVEHGAKIFPPAGLIGRAMRTIRRLRRYGYDSEALEDALLSILGEATLGEARTRLCIPSFEGRHGEPWLYKTPHHPDYQRDRVERMVKVALATSAAPTFLKAVPNNGYVMVDGGLWANNPVMNAIVDALACFELNRHQIRVLSLGCGETSFKVGADRATGGLFKWMKVFDAAMRAQSLNALGQAYLLLGKPNVIRIDAPETPRRIQMDDYHRARGELPNLARSLVEAGGAQVLEMFLQTAAEPFIACAAAGLPGTSMPAST